HQSLGADPGLDLVLDFLGTAEHAAEIAGRATAFAAPHAPRDGAAQGGHRQPAGPFLRCRLVASRRLRPTHFDDVLPDPRSVVRATRTAASRVYISTQILFRNLHAVSTVRIPRPRDLLFEPVASLIEYSLPRCRLSAMFLRPASP